jgi:hypothetical protein
MTKYKKTGFYLRPQIGNPAFDFLLSNYDKVKKDLTIYLIKATLKT